jgi:hypothetical protein
VDDIDAVSLGAISLGDKPWLSFERICRLDKIVAGVVDVGQIVFVAAWPDSVCGSLMSMKNVCVDG